MKSFYYHHVVEGHTTLFLALHRTGNDRRLCGVESGQDTACHRDEEDRDKVVCAEVVTVQDTAHAFQSSQISVEREAEGKDTDKYSDSGEQQDRTEDRVDPSDDLVDREYRRDQIVYKDHAVDHPCGYGRHRTVKSEHLSRRDISRCVDKHRTHEEEQQAAEDLIECVDPLVAVLADHIRHLGPAVAQADHAGESNRASHRR